MIPIDDWHCHTCKDRPIVTNVAEQELYSICTSDTRNDIQSKIVENTQRSDFRDKQDIKEQRLMDT